MKGSDDRKDKQYEDKYYSTRRAAFRDAKRDNGIPVTQHPNEVIRPDDEQWHEFGLDETRNRALYRFILYLLNLVTGFFEQREVQIREDKDFYYGRVDKKGDQSEHFNSGEVLGDDTKLRRHHYYTKRKK